jgi:hypothetical protein
VPRIRQATRPTNDATKSSVSPGLDISRAMPRGSLCICIASRNCCKRRQKDTRYGQRRNRRGRRGGGICEPL